MPGKDTILQNLHSDIESAQRDIDSAKSRLDSISSRRDSIQREIESCKYRIEDLKHSRDREYEAARYCRQCHDKYSADNHRYNAESFKNALEREYSIKSSYIEQSKSLGGEFQSALSALRSAKERKQRAQEAFNQRLETLKRQQQSEREMWKEKRCSKCGATIRYRIDWAHPPSICKNCKDKFKKPY